MTVNRERTRLYEACCAVLLRMTAPPPAPAVVDPVEYVAGETANALFSGREKGEFADDALALAEQTAIRLRGVGDSLALSLENLAADRDGHILRHPLDPGASIGATALYGPREEKLISALERVRDVLLEWEGAEHVRGGD